jgi:hypothetical protein
MKNIFEISSDEKQKILEMHINATKKHYLNEEIGCKRDVKTTPETLGLVALPEVPVILDYSGDDFSKWHKTTKEQLRKSINNTQIKAEETCRQKTKYGPIGGTLRQFIIKSTDDVGVKALGSIMKDINYADTANDVREQEISYLYVLNDLATDFLNIWNSEESGNKDLVVTLTESKTALPTPAPTQVNGGGLTNMVLPPFKPTGDLYKNNYWEVTENLKSQFQQQIIKPITEAKAAVPGIQISLKSLSVDTSASRIRNTGPEAGNLTFLELSQNRNNSTVIMLQEMLKNAGVLNVDKVKPVQDFKAEKSDKNPSGNGDGSSGPNPPESSKYAFVPVGNFKMSTPGKDRNEAGKPIENLQEYEKFKFVKVNVVLEAKFQPETTINTKVLSPKEVKDYTYDISVGGTSKRKRTPKFHIGMSFGKSGGKPKPKPVKDFLHDIFNFDFELCAAYD